MKHLLAITASPFLPGSLSSEAQVTSECFIFPKTHSSIPNQPDLNFMLQIMSSGKITSVGHSEVWVNQGGAGEPSIQSLHILWRRGKGRLLPQQNKNLYIFPECSGKQRNWGNEVVGPVGPQVVQQEALYGQWLPHETPKEQGGGWLQNCASPGLLCSMWKWTFCPDERKISVSFWFW